MLWCCPQDPSRTECVANYESRACGHQARDLQGMSRPCREEAGSYCKTIKLMPGPVEPLRSCDAIRRVPVMVPYSTGQTPQFRT